MLSLRDAIAAYDHFDMQWQLDRGLSATEKLVITYLWSEHSANMTAISERVGLTTGGATSLVDRLERDGYVRRRPDAHDRRRMIVELTDKGSEARTALNDVLQTIAQRGHASEWRPLLETLADELQAGAIRLRNGLRDRAADPD